jgi:phosphomannomutase
VHATDQLSIRVSDLSVIAAAMTRLRSDPPATLGASPVVRVHDLEEGGSVNGGPPLPPTDGLLYRTAEGARVVVRPSGTEPKLKCYLEAVVPVTDGDLDGARALAAATLLALREDLTALLRV